MDASHTSLQTGKVEQHPSTIFAENFGKYLKWYSQRCPATRIILIPSVKDILSNHYVFPQGALDPQGLNLPQVGITLYGYLA